MIAMNINKSTFYYALYQEKEEITDEWGNNIGEYRLVFGKPKECRANISGAKGETEARLFGTDLAYDKVIVIDNHSIPPIDEFSRLWIDVVPEMDADGECITPHDYIVKKIAKSINTTSIAVSRVKVS